MALKSKDRTRAMINKNFLIRVTDREKKETSLVGAGRYMSIVDNEKLKIKHFNKVLNGGLDRYTFLLRRGIKIEFVSK